jgi:hypothetical protein
VIARYGGSSHARAVARALLQSVSWPPPQARPGETCTRPQAKTKLASLALAAFITLVINGSLVWEFDQMAAQPGLSAAFNASADRGAFEI